MFSENSQDGSYPTIAPSYQKLRLWTSRVRSALRFSHSQYGEKAVRKERGYICPAYS